MNQPPPDTCDSVLVTIGSAEFEVEFYWTDDGTPRRLPVQVVRSVLLCIDGDEYLDVTNCQIVGFTSPGRFIEDHPTIERAMEQAVHPDVRAEEQAAYERDGETAESVAKEEMKQ